MEREIKRDHYLEQLICRKHNSLIKIVTGIRRCGKSYLLRTLFKKHLLENGVVHNVSKGWIRVTLTEDFCMIENTGKPIEQIAIDTERDNYMYADEAMAYGLIDKVIANR